MELKSMIAIEIEKNDRVFSFLLPVGAPFGEAYDAAFEVLGKIIEMSKEAADNMKASEDKDAVIADDQPSPELRQAGKKKVTVSS